MVGELKPCPFCGHPPVFRQIPNDGRWTVDCHTVTCVRPSTGILRSREKVLAAWNTRTPSALIAAGDALMEFAGHDDECQIMTHGVWSDPIPCDCGYTAAVAAWRDARGESE
jgi:hypothetical protein